MDAEVKSQIDKNNRFDLNDQNSKGSSHNHCDTHNDEQEKGHWRELFLESGGADDSGHFTASPETDHSGLSGCSGSSRGHSPVHFHDGSSQPQTQSAAALVLKAFRDNNTSNKKGDHLGLSVCPTSNSSSAPSAMTQQHTLMISAKGDDCSNSTDYLRTALDNFNDLYKQKLRMVEDVGAQGDAYAKQIVMEKKASILECWAKDVCVQNIVLIHTVEELEKQGDEKLKLLQHKISESSNLAKKHMEVIKKYENKIRTLLKEKEISLDERKALKIELDKLKSECRRARDRVRYLEKDNDSLVALITRIRDMGVWDVAGLELHKRTYEQIFGLYPNLPGSEVQTVFTRDRAQKIQDTEEKVAKLEQDVLELTDHRKRSEMTLISRDSKITELESELRNISSKLQHCQVECEHYKKSLIETQEKLLEATKELQIKSRKPSRASTPTAADAARHAEIQELLQELRDVKTQLSASVNESQTAKEEANMIRREFSERLRAMQESQQCLQTELTHSFDTHNQMQEKEMELSKIKEQIQIYQSKCDSADQLLSKKDQIIDDLQKQILLLNEKISDIKEEWNRVFSHFDDKERINADAEESRQKNGGLHSASLNVEESGSVDDIPILTDSVDQLTLVDYLKTEFAAEKAKMEEDFQKELKDKDIEITMQKVTIQHLQDALVALKRGQPIPVPQSSAVKVHANGANCGKVFEI